MQPNLLHWLTENIQQGVELPKVKPCLAIFCSQHRRQVIVNLNSQDSMTWKHLLSLQNTWENEKIWHMINFCYLKRQLSVQCTLSKYILEWPKKRITWYMMICYFLSEVISLCGPFEKCIIKCNHTWRDIRLIFIFYFQWHLCVHALQSRDQLCQKEHFRDAEGLSTISNQNSQTDQSIFMVVIFCIQKLDLFLFAIIQYFSTCFGGTQTPRLSWTKKSSVLRYVYDHIFWSWLLFVFSAIESSTSRRHWYVTWKLTMGKSTKSSNALSRVATCISD